MKLSKLVEKVEYELICGELTCEVNELVYDSRNVTPHSVFVCIIGANSDGHSYISDVVSKGASALIVQHDVKPMDHVTILRVKDSRNALAYLSAAYFSYPAEKLKTIGITGTKGKTTTAYMVYSILKHAGIKTGLIGTIETIIGEHIIPANNTTPESYLLQKYFKEMVDAGCECVVMEVSSQGLMLKRVAGFIFDYGIFTNLEPDHIGPNEHKSFEEYMHCKGLLFKNCRVGIANMDDIHMEQVLKGYSCELETYGKNKKADLCAENIDLHSDFGTLGVNYDVTGKINFHVHVNVPGEFSVYNSLTAIAICRHFDIPVETMKEAFLQVLVKGRVELIPISNRFTLMIDYAHNAMSLNSLLTTLKEYQPKRLVCMFGCGGNRSRDRRFEMGEISSKLADLTIVTSDNPRFEEPEAIMEDIITGVKRASGKYIAIANRKEAIRYCITHANEGDVIVLAGKGHEDYQEIKGVKYPMDERVLINAIVSEMTMEEKQAAGVR